MAILCIIAARNFMIKKLITTFLGLLLGLFLFAVGLVTVAILVTYPKLPPLDAVVPGFTMR